MKNKLWDIINVGLFALYILLMFSLGFENYKTIIIGIVFFLSITLINYKKLRR
jgi:hypothetical protein